MLVIAQHQIHDAEKFWSSAKSLTSTLPAHIKIHSVFPSVDLKSGTCIWEAPSVMEVQNFLDDNVGDISKNFCYELNQETAVNLPQISMEAAHN